MLPILQSSVKDRIAQKDRELDASRLEIQAIRKRFKEAETELTKAHARRTELKRLRFDLAAEIAPIKKIPYEVLSHIFLLAIEKTEEPECCDEPWEDDPVLWTNRLLALPVILSQVNRYFRDVAITTAQLWTNINVGTRKKAPYEYTKLLMERTKNQPLDVDITYFGTSRTRHEQGPDVANVLSALQPSAGWRSFTLTVDSYPALRAGLMQCHSAAPQLQQLKLVDSRAHHHADDFKWDSLRKPVDIFTGVAPALSSVSLRGVHLSWKSPMLSGLSELELMFHANELRPKAEEFLKILRTSPGLRRLVLMASGPRLKSHGPALPVSSTNVVQLAALERLEIGGLPPRNITFILTSISAPALKAISLDTWLQSDYSEPLGLVNQSRYPALLQLKLVRVALRDDFSVFLKALPNLEQLEIYQDNLLQSLIASDRDPARASPPVVPKLRRLRTSGLGGQAVIEFLQRRKDLGFALDSLMMNRWEEPDDQTQRAIRRLVTFGYFRGEDKAKNGDESESEWEYDSTFSPM